MVEKASRADLNVPALFTGRMEAAPKRCFSSKVNTGSKDQLVNTFFQQGSKPVPKLKPYHLFDSALLQNAA